MPQVSQFKADHHFVSIAQEASGTPPYPLALFVAEPEADGIAIAPTGSLIGYLPPKYHAEAELVIESGTDVRLSLTDYVLTFALVRDDDEQSPA
ncbi:hypothetical protein A5681_19755 [Mycobacterium scrofulaceum]|nr:hypothetical protein A5681_19755 [Mycobacterium scrofulaceum]